MEGDRPHPRWTQFRSHFNPLPPHGGRHWIDGFFDKFAKISIHSLRMEGDDAKHATRCLLICDFNPLPPHGGRQHSDTVSKYSYFISIHSLRMEGDYLDLGYLCGGGYFNPLPPHGGRQDKLPVEANFENISIHSLRMEGDTLIWLTEILQ